MKNLLFIMLLGITNSTFAAGDCDGLINVYADEFCACKVTYAELDDRFTKGSFSDCSAKLAEQCDIVMADPKVPPEASLEPFLKKFQQETGGGVICSRKEITEWYKDYKKGQKADIATAKLEIAKKYCGLAKDKTSADNKTEFCVSNLIATVDDETVASIKEECSENKLNNSKKTKKNCVEEEKAKYVIRFETEIGDKKISVMTAACTDNATIEKCLDDVIKEIGKTSCSYDKAFTAADAQKICRQMAVLSHVNDVDAAKTCLAKAKDAKEKAVCIKSNVASKNGEDSGELEILKVEILKPIIVQLPTSTTEPELKESDFDKDDIFTKAQFKEFLKDNPEVSRSERRACLKAYVKGSKNNPKATQEEVYKYLEDSKCPISKILASSKSNGAELEMAEFKVLPPTVVKLSDANTEAGPEKEISDAEIDKPDVFTKGEFKDFLKNKLVSDDERRTCIKAFKKGRKNIPNATEEEAFKFLEDSKCPISKIIDGTNDGGVCLAKAKVQPDAENPIFKDDYFYKRYKGACNMGAPEVDQDKIIGCYAEARKNVSEAKNIFLTCTERVGLSKDYSIMSLGQAFKKELRVAGCEKQYAAHDLAPTPETENDMKDCIIKRVGQEAAKAILAELAKDGVYRLLKDECEKKHKDNPEKLKECLIKLKNTSNMIGAFSAIGLDTMSCIPSKEAREGGVITDSAKFCEYYLKAGTSVDSKYTTPTAKNRCSDKVKFCDQYKSKSDQFQSCGRAVVECTKKWVDANNGMSTSWNDAGCSEEQMANNMIGDGRSSSDPGFKSQMCIAGALSSGLKAITSAICANEKKYPTSADKEACMKKLQVVNELGTAGATAAKCMEMGPAPMSDADELKLSPEDAGKRDALKAIRNTCLAKGLGDQAVGLITQKVCEAKKTQEEKELCFKRAGIVKVAGDAAFRVANCQVINKTPYSVAMGGDAKMKSDYQACMQNAVLDSAFSALSSELAADVACKKHKDDKEKFEECKTKYKSTVKLVGVGVSAAQRMAHCAKMVDPEKSSCLVTASLSAGGEVLGQIGELACAKHKDNPAELDKCVKKYNAAGEVLKLAGTTNEIFKNIDKCKGDQACLAGVLAKQLPGDAGVYASFAMQGWGLIRQKNTCKVPSKYLEKAGALVKIAGDLTTHIVHKVQSDQLKKKYADLVHDEKVQGGDLFSNIKGFVDQQKADKAKEKAEEPMKKFATESEANEAQLRGLVFARVNEENTLQSSLWQRPFLYASNALNISATTMAVFEQMAEIARDAGQTSQAPWKPCTTKGEPPPDKVDWGATIKGASLKLKINRQVNMASINNGFEGLNNHQSYAFYEDYERFIDGEIKSITLDEYEQMGKIGLDEKPIPLSQSLKIAANYTFNIIPKSEAMDFAVLENIGVNMIGGLFPGSGGFGQGSPVGYAQDIVYLFIKKGLELACNENKKNAEGKCEYTGKATIEFAAKLAARAILKKQEPILNNYMKTPAGRIVIAGWNLGKIVKLVADNEKIITAQREKVQFMKSKEEQFKADSATVTNYSEKLKYFINNYVIADAWAKAMDSENNLKVCLDKRGDVDFKCSCRKTGCYEIMPIQDKAFKNNLNSMNSKFGNTFAQGLNATNAMSNMVNQMFSGARGTEDVNVDQMKMTSEKLERFNKSLIAASNKMMTKMTGKPIDYERHVADIDKKMFAGLHPAVQRNLANVKLGSLAPQISVRDKNKQELDSDEKALAAELSNSANTVPVAGTNSTDPANDVLETTETKVETEEVQVVKADTEMNSAMTRTYSYDKNDINLDKEISLFKVISGRYIKKKENLHKHD